MKFGFSLIGLVICILPMIMNIVYFALKEPNDNQISAELTSIKLIVLEWIEKISRMAYIILMCFMVSEQRLDYGNTIFWLTLFFLTLYTIAWLRYFFNERNVLLLSKSLLFVPLPMAVFPVTYFLLAAIWCHNIFAQFFMAIFGVVHIIISRETLK
jgi:hypothetical protein